MTQGYLAYETMLSKYPLHLTLMYWDSIEPLDLNPLKKVIAHRLYVSAGTPQLFGKRREFPVITIQDHNLTMIRDELEREYGGTKFSTLWSPHITLKGLDIRQGWEILVDLAFTPTITLMNPYFKFNEQPKQYLYNEEK